MSERTLLEYNRRNPGLRKSEVVDVLPSYFVDEYPNLITFLEKYYDSLERSGQLTDQTLHDLFGLRDFDEVSLAYIDRIFFEIAENISPGLFSDPRLIGKLIPVLLREKGTKFAAENFFKLIYGIDTEISYPKERLLTTNVSKIGPDGDILQDGRRYQVLSILVKSGLDFNTWKDLYKKLVHPSGYYLSADVTTTGVGNLTMMAPLALLDSGQNVVLVGEGSFELTGYGEEGILMTNDSDGLVYISSPDRTLGTYGDVTLGSLDENYNTLAEVSQIGTPTFDEDSAVGDKAVEFDVSYETFDKDQYIISYNPDSA